MNAQRICKARTALRQAAPLMSLCLRQCMLCSHTGQTATAQLLLSMHAHPSCCGIATTHGLPTVKSGPALIGSHTCLRSRVIPGDAFESMARV